ncbi:MAG: hypothetical protein V7661_10950 [Sulfitobacter sp.]
MRCAASVVFDVYLWLTEARFTSSESCPAKLNVLPIFSQLLSTRKALLKKTMDLANEVRGLLKVFGVRLHRTVRHGSFDGLVRPMIEMDDVLSHVITPLLYARTVLLQHFLELQPTHC